MEIELYDTDYVLFKDGKPRESLDIIYSDNTIQEQLDNGLVLEEGEEFIKMTELPVEVQERYIKRLKEIYTFDQCLPPLQ
tara:strand:- start:56 stop:295 length:240 start_codon:yes stop_codon:yes gene_type:complete